jgi:hypothetical protein
MWLVSMPVTPSMSGFSDFIHPSMWSKERFSCTSTTTVLILLSLLFRGGAAAIIVARSSTIQTQVLACLMDGWMRI